MSKSLSPGTYIRIERPFCEDTHHSGIFVGMGKDFVLIHTFHDFYPEGYTLLRKSDIKRIVCGPHESFMQHILTEEQMINLGNFEKSFFKHSMNNVLSEFINEYISIDCKSINVSASESDSYFGRLLSLSHRTASMKVFTSLGEWVNETVEIECKYISQIEFDTAYLNIITKYLK